MSDTRKQTVLLVDGYSLIFRGFHALPLLTAPDGVRVEFNAGGDLWRHRAAAYLPDAKPEEHDFLMKWVDVVEYE